MELGRKKGFFGRLSERIGDVILARPTIDEDLLDDLEEVLITSDIGMETTMRIIEQLRSDIKSERIREPEQVKEQLKTIIAVSYTHLDVYKRQPSHRACEIHMPEFFHGRKIPRQMQPEVRRYESG